MIQGGHNCHVEPLRHPFKLFHGRVWWLHPSLENARRLGPPRQGEPLTYFIDDLRVGVLKVQQNLFPQQQLFVFEQGLKVRRETGMELLLFCSKLDSSFHPFFQEVGALGLDLKRVPPGLPSSMQELE